MDMHCMLEKIIYSLISLLSACLQVYTNHVNVTILKLVT